MFGFGKPKSGEIDRLFSEYGPKGDWDGLRRKLEAINPKNLSGAEREKWSHARGVVEFHAGDHQAALSVFEKARREFPRSGLIRFGLGQEYELLGRIDEMAGCFSGVKLAEVGGRYFMTMVRYLYLWQRLDEAREALSQVFDIYRRLGALDPHFLFMRGLPFFSEAFGTLSALAVVAGRPDLAETELDRARRRFKDYIFDFDAAALAAEVRNDRRPLIEWADRQAVETARLQGPTGYYSMLAAVHRARGRYSLEEARSLAEKVVLTTKDLNWLEDLRLIFRAELAAAAEDWDEEQRLLQEFFARQPRMFEPHHAFTFGLVKYQERIRPACRQARRV